MKNSALQFQTELKYDIICWFWDKFIPKLSFHRLLFFPGKHTQTRCVVIFFPLCNVITNSKKRVMQITLRWIDETEYLLGCNIIYDEGPQTLIRGTI